MKSFRKEANITQKKIVDRDISRFYYKSLLNESNNCNWKINLESLKKNIENIKLFPKLNSFKVLFL